MKRWLAALTMTLALGLAHAASAATVKYDYDRDVDFAAWKTFAWSGPAAPGASLTEKRLERAVEDGFEAKGYRLVERPAEADFLIACRAAAWRDVSLSESWHGPAFGRDLSVQRVARGALLVDVVDRRTGRLAWRGTVSDDLAGSPEQADKRTAKAVEKLLKKFPPVPKK